MGSFVEIAIMGKSLKNGGYCVAGIEIHTNRWVRLVSSDEPSCGALFHPHMQYEDNSFCVPLDVVRVPFLRPYPHIYQPENILIDENKRWKKLGKISIYDLLRFHPPETHQYLLGNLYPYITATKVGSVGHSLILVEVTHLVITHPRERSTKAEFFYQSTRYENISVTDPEYYSTTNNFRLERAILIMSLPNNPYNDRYYKFIAKIYPLVDEAPF